MSHERIRQADAADVHHHEVPAVTGTAAGAPDEGLIRAQHAAEHVVLPPPTYWPIGLAFAITLLAWSVVTSLLITAVGLVIFAVALAGWIGDLLHED